MWRQTNPICFYFLDEEIRPSNIKVSHIGELGEPASHGYSSFKFIPGTQDKVIIALKSEELEGKIATYVMVFNIDGTILFPETKIGDLKFEGIEFVWWIKKKKKILAQLLPLKFLQKPSTTA